MPKDKIRLVTTVSKELHTALKAACEEGGISEAMVIRLALGAYLEVPLSENDKLALRRQARPVDIQVLDAAKTSGLTRKDAEIEDTLTRIRRERGLTP